MLFSAIMMPGAMVFTVPSGKVYTLVSSSVTPDEYSKAVTTAKTISGLIRSSGEGDEGGIDAMIDTLVALASPAVKIVQAGEGRVTVTDGVVYYDDSALHGAVVDRILWGLKEGFEMTAHLRFIERIMLNPSKRAIDETFRFIESNRMGLSDDGFILAYKVVADDFTDIHSHTFDNSPGKVCEMPRNAVNDNPNVTCSDGLHVCSHSYLRHYGQGGGSRIVIVKIDPADVVSIPIDYNNAKMRCCRYEVIAEYTAEDKDDILASKPVWSTSEFFGSDKDDVGDDEDEDEEDEDDEGDEDEEVVETLKDALEDMKDKVSEIEIMLRRYNEY